MQLQQLHAVKKNQLAYPGGFFVCLFVHVYIYLLFFFFKPISGCTSSTGKVVNVCNFHITCRIPVV